MGNQGSRESVVSRQRVQPPATAAYSKIKDQAIQRQMVSLMEAVADNEDE
jgi:hypothetical protein